MTSIGEWNKAQEDTYFYEEINPPELSSTGSLKTRNPSGGSGQPRPYWHVSNEESHYKKTVEIVTCAHGKDHNDEDVTLIVLRVQLSCTNTSRFKTVDLRFNFKPKDSAPSGMPIDVLCWAPFYDRQGRSKTGEETVTSRTRIDGSLGVEIGGPNAGLSSGRESEKSFKRDMYARAQSEPMYNSDSGVVTGVHWHFSEASKQKDGVLPNFHLAMLVRPPRTRETNIAQTFTGMLHIRVDAGFKEDAYRFFRERPSDNHPVIFDPSQPLHVRGTGERLRSVLGRSKSNRQEGQNPPQNILNGVDVTQNDLTSGGYLLGDCIGDGLLGIIGHINGIAG